VLSEAQNARMRSGFAIPNFSARGWSSERTSPEEWGPIETQPGRKAETDRVRDGISEGFRPAESERVTLEVR